MKLAALYTRISQADETVDKPADQEADLRRLAAREGYDVTAVFTDDDVSAFEGKHDRPGFRALVVAVADGRFDVVMATEPQRFTRGSATELEALNLALVKANAVYHTMRAGIQDPSTPMVRGMLQMQDVLAWIEVAVAQDRQRSRNAADRARGIPKRALRPFGFEVGGMVIRESEATHIREATRSILEDGESMTQIARRWTLAGIRTDGMNRSRKGRDGVKRPARDYWTTTTVRQLLLRARNAGILMHDGAELPVSQIQPIITRAELDALRARVKAGTPVGARAKSELGGILRCECGAPMHQTTGYSQRKGGPRNVYPLYKCSVLAYDRAHFHASINAHIADAKVADYVVLAYMTGDLTPGEDASYKHRATEIAERLAALIDQETKTEGLLIEGLGDARRLRGRLQAIRAEREQLRSEQEQSEATRASGKVAEVLETFRDRAVGQMPSTVISAARDTFADLGEVWASMDLEDRQAVVRARFTVTCRVGGRGPSRIAVDLRDPSVTPFPYRLIPRVNAAGPTHD